MLNLKDVFDFTPAISRTPLQDNCKKWSKSTQRNFAHSRFLWFL